MKNYLDSYVVQFNKTDFIEPDPISIPHSYSRKQDIEITAFWTAMLSWGQRKTIINKSKLLFELMDNAPYDFIMHHKESDRAVFESFKHRTFQPIDTLYFLEFFQQFYTKNESLEMAFYGDNHQSVKEMLIGFHDHFFNLECAPKRTRKHVSTPKSNSSCKRLNMFLRWMVRKDENGVDFGIWKSIKPSQLMIPLDVHVGRVARKLGLLQRKQNDWKAVVELTERLKMFDSNDPVKYDYALFSLGTSLSN